MLTALAKFSVAQIAFGSDICKNRRIPVNIFVSPGNALLMTTGIIERLNININRNTAAIQRSRLEPALPEHTDISLKDLRIH